MAVTLGKLIIELNPCIIIQCNMSTTEAKQHCFDQSQSHFYSSRKNALPCPGLHVFSVENTMSQYTKHGEYIKCDNLSSLKASSTVKVSLPCSH